MNRKSFLCAVLLAAFIVSNVALAIGQDASAHAVTTAAKPSAGGLTATFHDYDASGTTLMLLRSDDFNGTGQATYAPSSSRGSTIGSGFVNGEWNLNLAQQSVRTLYITPNDPIDNLQPAGQPAGYYSDVTSRCGCFDQNGNIVPLGNVVTSSGNCKLGVNFTVGGVNYKLLLSPFPLSGGGDPPPACPPSGCPPTGVVTVTCNAVSNNQCVDWTIEPNVTAPNANVANLYLFSATPRPAGSWVFIGQYHNTFRIGLTNP